MPALPRRAVRPKVATVRKGRIGPRIPAPDMTARHIDHAPAAGHGRVVPRIIPMGRNRPDIGRLQRIIAPPVRIMRQHAFGTHRVQKLVGLVGGLVQRRTADLGEPDGLRAGHPCTRLLRTNPVGPVVMQVLPPAFQILVTPDPRLVIAAVGDRRADLRIAIRIRGIEPVIALAPRDIRQQVIGTVDPPPMRVQMVGPIAPVRQRHVIVDADEIDIVIGPKRVEVKEQLSISGVVAEIFRPDRRITDLDRGPQDGAHISRQLPQTRHGGIAARRPPDLRHTHHLGPDQKGVDPPRCRAKMRVMQDEATIGPFGRAVVIDPLALARKIADRRRAEKRRHLGCRRRRPVA